MNALHKYVVREMSSTERRELIGLRGMLDEGIRDIENEIASAQRRLEKAKAHRADIQKKLEAL